jgi:hypothetical protein
MNKETAIASLKNDIPLTDFIRGVNKKINNYWTSMNWSPRACIASTTSPTATC